MAISHDYGGDGNRLPDPIQETTLYSLFSNPLLLCHTVDYLPVSATLSLGGTSREFRNLIYHTPSVFRRLDLSPVKIAQFDIDPIDQGGETWRNVQVDENVTEDEYVPHGATTFFLIACSADLDMTSTVSMPVLSGVSSPNFADGISCGMYPRWFSTVCP